MSWKKVLARSQGGLGASPRLPGTPGTSGQPSLPGTCFQSCGPREGVAAVAGGRVAGAGLLSALCPHQPGVNSSWSLTAPPSSPL